MKIKIRIVKAQSEDPPYESSGRGMPMTGINPIVIPILINRCMNMQEATQYP